MLKGFCRLYLSIYSYIQYDILDPGNSFHGFCHVCHMTRKVSYIVGEIYFSCLPKLSYLQDQALAERAQPTSWARWLRYTGLLSSVQCLLREDAVEDRRGSSHSPQRLSFLELLVKINVSCTLWKILKPEYYPFPILGHLLLYLIVWTVTHSKCFKQNIPGE